MSIRKLQSPDDLIQYALRSLGAPVINIEIEYEQCLDRIDDTLQKFILGHFDGVSEIWKPYVITTHDVSRGYLLMPDNVVSIRQIIDPFPNDGSNPNEAFERINYQLAQSDWLKNVLDNSAGLASWEIGMQRLELIKHYFSPDPAFRYNHITRQFFIDHPIAPGQFMFFNVYESIDPSEAIDVFNNEWVKRYAKAMVGMQWGANIRKYEGVQLPGGLTLNGQRIYEEFKQEVERLDGEFSEKYEEPPDFFMA